MYLKQPLKQRSLPVPSYPTLLTYLGSKMFLLIIIILLPSVVFAQSRVTGKVIDDDALPLSGVSVRIAGTQTGATTNSDGVFPIRASKGQVLEVSYIGKLD